MAVKKVAEPKTFLSRPRILVTKKFIKNNKLKIISEKEILEIIKSKTDSLFSFDKEVFVDYLPLEEAKKFLTEESAKAIKEWNQITTIEEAAQDFLDYMNFAWGKALDKRGLSASRSIEKLGAWLQVMSRPDLATLIDTNSLYNPYGAPALIAVCKNMGIKIPEELVVFSKNKCA